MDGDVDSFTMIDSEGLVIKTTMVNDQNYNIKTTAPNDNSGFEGKASWKCEGNLEENGYIYLRNMNIAGDILTTTNTEDVFPYLGIDTEMVSENDLDPETSGWIPKEMEC
jgi:hypothetical protein